MVAIPIFDPTCVSKSIIKSKISFSWLGVSKLAISKIRESISGKATDAFFWPNDEKMAEANSIIKTSVFIPQK